MLPVLCSYRHRLLLLVALVVALSVSAVSGQEHTEEPTATAEATATDAVQSIGQYERLTLRVEINPNLYTNPFDPDDIELVGIFQSPSGEQRVIPGFWMQPYEDECAAPPCRQESLRPTGVPQWQVRFSPPETGVWTYTLQVRDNGNIVSSEDGEFRVAPSNAPGFIRVARNRRYFQFQNGQSYFPIGNNLQWSWQGAGGWHAYARWFDELAQSGGNYARVVVDVPWFIGLEWDTVGHYGTAQDDAARFDRLLELAEQYGIRLQLVLLWHQSLINYNGPPVLIPEQPARPSTNADWRNNPYNRANGGPLNGASQFFFNETADALFRRRLRYIAARWGYSPNVFAWELVDELDTASGNSDAAYTWVQSMTSYLRQIDQNRHLITAGSREPNARLVANAQLDFTEGRVFQRLPIERSFEQVPGVIDTVRGNLQASRSPTLITAFSLNPWFEPTASDPDGVHFQNSIWASALAGSAGAAASAWGETYVMPLGLERYYAPLAAFAAGVGWASLDLQPAEAALLTGDEAAYQPVRVEGFSRQFRATPGAAATRVISGDGVYPGVSSISAYLYGQVYNKEFSQSQTYRVTVPFDTYFEAGVRGSSDQAIARLAITVDDAPAAEMRLSQSSRPAALRVPLSAGEHTIVLANTGEDWLELEYLEVGVLVAPARVLTLRDTARGIALAWVQHRDYTWENIAEGETPQPLQLTYLLDEMPPGRYLVELWDPLSGAVLGEESLRVRQDGLLRFDLLPLTRQLALRMFRQPDAPAATPSPTPERATPTETATATETPEPEATAERTPLIDLDVHELGSPLPPRATPEATVEATAEATDAPTREPTATRTPRAPAPATNTPRP